MKIQINTTIAESVFKIQPPTTTITIHIRHFQKWVNVTRTPVAASHSTSFHTPNVAAKLVIDGSLMLARTNAQFVPNWTHKTVKIYVAPLQLVPVERRILMTIPAFPSITLECAAPKNRLIQLRVY